jgi:hypothetical protein
MCSKGHALIQRLSDGLQLCALQQPIEAIECLPLTSGVALTALLPDSARVALSTASFRWVFAFAIAALAISHGSPRFR